MGFGILTFIHSQLPLILYSLCMTVSIAAFAGRREIGFYFLLFILPFTYTLNKAHQYPFGNQLLDIILISLTISVFLHQKNRIRSISATPILLHIIVVLLSFMYGYINEGPISFGEFGHSFRVNLVKNYLTIPLLYWLTLAFLQVKDHDLRMRIVVFFILFIVLIVDWRFWDSARWRSHAHFSYGVRDGAFGSLGSNHLSAFVVEYTAVAVSLFLHYKNRKAKVFFFIVMIGSLYPIFFTYSRAGYVAIIAVLVFNFSFKKKYFLGVLVFIALAGSVVINYLPGSVVERVTMTQTEDGEIESSSEKRLILWDKGTRLFLENPIFGIGYQMVPGYVNVQGLRNLHNYILQMLVETGIIGFSIFLFLLFSAFRSGWKLFVQTTENFYKGVGLGFCGCVLASIICNLFGDRWSFIQMQGYWWVLWAVCDSKLLLIAKQSD